MSGKAVGWALEQTLPLAEKMVLVVLGDAASNEDFSCYPSIPRLAALAGVSARKARYCLGALEQAGLVAVEERFDKSGRRTSNRYVLAVEGPQDVAGDPAPDAGTKAAVQGGADPDASAADDRGDGGGSGGRDPARDAAPPARPCRETLHTGAGAYEPSERTNPPQPPQGEPAAAGPGAEGRPAGGRPRKRSRKGGPPPDPAFEALAGEARSIAEAGLRLSAEGRQAAREGWGREWALGMQGDIIAALKAGQAPPDPALLRMKNRKLFTYYRQQAAL